ncbi:MAG: chromosome partitioning protein [Gammaproteobacteria bacterium HGW-Gammaproteobacteria-14]|nr:MAG: chromosome partitioning protein [Gammaproteobacteria bacterium HGW-Gammaproteobacteria-14]
MTTVFAVANQKGGVGKTTSSVNLAASLAATRKRVLLIDSDPQGNATSGSGVDKHGVENTIYDVLVDEVQIEAAIVKTPEASGFDLIVANEDLTAAEVQLLDMKMKEFRLRNALARIKNRYDYILIDCPPSLNMLTVNALTAADSVIVPLQCEYYALEGLTALLNTIEKIRSVLNPKLHIGGILRTMYDPRNSLSNDVSNQLITHFGDKVYRTIIPRNVRLAEAPSHGAPVITYDAKSRGAISYLALAGEILRREQALQKQELQAES